MERRSSSVPPSLALPPQLFLFDQQTAPFSFPCPYLYHSEPTCSLSAHLCSAKQNLASYNLTLWQCGQRFVLTLSHIIYPHDIGGTYTFDQSFRSGGI